jgi:hypothetical protein
MLCGDSALVVMQTTYCPEAARNLGTWPHRAGNLDLSSICFIDGSYPDDACGGVR